MSASPQIIDLKLILNTRGRTAESRRFMLIDCEAFPDRPGVYAIRYADHAIHRMVGSSPVLKIGKAEGSIRERFRNYNHMRHVTKENRSLVDLLDEFPQLTNVRLMHFLSQEVHPSRIVVDCHFPQEGQGPRELEKDLLHAYLDEHRELPPLNFGFR